MTSSRWKHLSLRVQLFLQMNCCTLRSPPLLPYHLRRFDHERTCESHLMTTEILNQYNLPISLVSGALAKECLCLQHLTIPERRDQQWSECDKLHREIDAATSVSTSKTKTTLQPRQSNAPLKLQLSCTLPIFINGFKIAILVGALLRRHLP